MSASNFEISVDTLTANGTFEPVEVVTSFDDDKNCVVTTTDTIDVEAAPKTDVAISGMERQRIGDVGAETVPNDKTTTAAAAVTTAAAATTAAAVTASTVTTAAVTADAPNGGDDDMKDVSSDKSNDNTTDMLALTTTESIAVNDDGCISIENCGSYDNNNGQQLSTRAILNDINNTNDVVKTDTDDDATGSSSSINSSAVGDIESNTLAARTTTTTKNERSNKRRRWSLLFLLFIVLVVLIISFVIDGTRRRTNESAKLSNTNDGMNRSNDIDAVVSQQEPTGTADDEDVTTSSAGDDTNTSEASDDASTSSSSETTNPDDDTTTTATEVPPPTTTSLESDDTKEPTEETEEHSSESTTVNDDAAPIISAVTTPEEIVTTTVTATPTITPTSNSPSKAILAIPDAGLYVNDDSSSLTTTTTTQIANGAETESTTSNDALPPADVDWNSATTTEAQAVTGATESMDDGTTTTEMMDATCNDERKLSMPPVPFPGKKGAAFTLRPEESGLGGSYVENFPKIIALQPYWNYGWGMDLVVDHQPNDIEFVPMVWGGGGRTVDELQQILADRVLPYTVANGGPIQRLFGFNEPDQSKQSNMVVSRAVELWPALESLGVPLLSPSTAQPNREWNEEFMATAATDCLRTDWMGVHWYGDTNFNTFQRQITNLYEKYQRPLVLTEFACVEWKAENEQHSEAEVLEFMKQALPWLEEQSFIAGYTWFSFAQTSTVGSSSALFVLDDDTDDDDSTTTTPPTLTTLGRYYASVRNDNPSGDQSI